MLRVLCLCVFSVGLAASTNAASFRDLQAQRPELFHPDTGYRIERQRAPTPEDVPSPVILAEPECVLDLLAKGALALDVSGAAQSRFDDLDGTWLVSKERLSLPGAVWLPETGRGWLDPVMARYLSSNLADLTRGDLDHPIVVFCIADCWMSWNASQRIAALGYSRVFWFRLGTDGWLDIGAPLVRVDPIPVDLD